jgi:dTDP-4-dehydrorhamnose 3,5-epimerase
MTLQKQPIYHVEFVQDNHSFSRQWTLRGLHYQLKHTQGKLVQSDCRQSVFDVAVDLRKDSSTFGKWVGVELSSENHKQLWVPPGFAHGFLVLSETAEFLYKTTDYYDPKAKCACRGVIQASRLIGLFRWVSRPCSMPKMLPA